MKTFLPFIGIFLVCMLMSFSIWQKATLQEMIKFIIALQWAYIMYTLMKEEHKN